MRQYSLIVLAPFLTCIAAFTEDTVPKSGESPPIEIELTGEVKAKLENPHKKELVRVHVTTDGQFEVSGRKRSQAELQRVLSDAVGCKTESYVVKISTERDAPYTAVTHVFEVCKKLRIEQLGFIEMVPGK